MAFDFAEQIEQYVKRMDALRSSLPTLLSILHRAKSEFNTERNDFLEKHGQCDSSQDEIKTYSLPPEHQHKFRRIDHKTESVSTTHYLLPSTFLLTLVAQYDAHLGQLIRGIYECKPEALKASRRKIPLSLILSFQSIDEVKNYGIEKHVEAILRKSHTSQIDQLSSILGCRLRENLSIWPTFIEITERRNLFVHCDGVVSRQYLAVCEEHKFPFSEIPQIGSRLECTRTYCALAHRCLIEMGVKLGQVVWRRMRPEETSKADENLNNIAFDRLVFRDYPLSISLLEFALNPTTKHETAEQESIYRINLAQAYKWNGENEKCMGMLKKTDWSDRDTRFKLAVAVLSDQFTEAASLMRLIGQEGSIKKHQYAAWPVFKEFRRSAEFMAAYMEIYKEPFQLQEEEKTQVKEAVSNPPTLDQNTTLALN